MEREAATSAVVGAADQEGLSFCRDVADAIASSVAAAGGFAASAAAGSGAAAAGAAGAVLAAVVTGDVFAGVSKPDQTGFP